MQVIVIGDVMLDVYYNGKISRISPEAPVPIILNANETYTGGGAANVALNLSGLGLDAKLYGIVGQDELAQKLKSTLDKANIRYYLITSDCQPTITKRRILGNNHHVVRMDTESPFSKDYAEELKKSAESIEATYVVLSDYDKGSLIDIADYIKKFQSKGIRVIVDPKKELQAYSGAWFVKPNQAEFNKYVGAFSTHSELIAKAQDCIKRCHFEHMLVTLGSEGMMYINVKEAKFFAAETQSVADITGAGDTVIAGLIYGLMHQNSIEQSILLAKKMAELSVTQVGTYVLGKKDLHKLLGEII